MGEAIVGQFTSPSLPRLGVHLCAPDACGPALDLDKQWKPLLSISSSASHETADLSTRIRPHLGQNNRHKSVARIHHDPREQLTALLQDRGKILTREASTGARDDAVDLPREEIKDRVDVFGRDRKEPHQSRRLRAFFLETLPLLIASRSP